MVVDEVFTDMPNTEALDGDFVVDLTQGLELHIKFSGDVLIRDNFTGKKEKVHVLEHIKLSQAGLNVKLTPMQTACLFKAFQEKDNLKVIDKRFKDEQKTLSGVGF